MRLLQAEELFRKVLEVGSKNKATRLLGLDVGSKYVGVSVSDEKNRIALPLSVLCRTKTNVNLMADDFKTLVSKYSIAGFVVGYPFNLHGLPSPDGVQVRLLAGELCKTGKLDDLSYTYWDENFTSKCVEALLHPLNLKNWDEAKTMTDKFAAVCILQGYLDNMNRKLRSTAKSEA
ncbi:hypothetical protein BDA96_03G330900 [Sorghum bicolor]|uniref:YqgF/RNase H-like domain-containing protein n=2 Tax=Sorghum bicolor TaxID=4558 RepID=A0A921UPD2_SORBI|nr:uncharacterized protein LOC8079245 [Sorghum bicolor]XP_021311493.1 uncharacterized protein LOC8079245 [Sorghum bicolor]XP_021311494.1 uncharacterized protein LOC8079245 [Sorghum bicolor]KAG0539532.1 hypothetical protein BDA96_03G330900 [Sorghum bicolor]KAG0539533.1 hypothetical protein BDA96_03G330900 [Sorghum bicolor]KXG33442.1 hypothetical protein SORBI_3003G306400 [Sorghum bicolor]OQU87605.1 hypothetical protein SORBI_3003G306400 [Sorghum bicolor]|eukprot:XP_002456396.2 uncharacterized protein LOC8079245 [Sorghum bicolor]